MANARAFCQWDIWQVTWIHKDDGTSKDRPALLLSTTDYNAKHDLLWFAKISTPLHNVPLRIELNSGDPAFAGTGLTHTCHLYLGSAREIHKDAILSYRGFLNKLAGAMIQLRLKADTGWTPP